MAFSTSDLPRALRNKASELCRMIESSARAGAVGWAIDSEKCFAEHGIVWAAERLYCSVRVAIDERKGKVHHVSIELPEEFELGQTLEQSA